MIHPRRSDARGAFLQHPTVRGLQERCGGGCPREAMRTLALEATQRARRLGWTGPPFDVEVLASLYDLQVRAADWLNDDQDGCLVPGRPSVVYINDAVSKNRARYTVAHEIAHALLREFETGPAEERRWKYRYDGQSPVEQLCQVGASELLMPTDVLASVVRQRDVSLALIREIASHFEVSAEASARNLVDRSPRPCAMIVLQLMNKPAELSHEGQIALPGFDVPTPPKRLRVHYGWTSRAMDDCFLAPFKSIPDQSLLYKLLEHGLGATLPETIEDWSEVAGIGQVTVEGTVLAGNASEAQMLCLVRK